MIKIATKITFALSAMLMCSQQLSAITTSPDVNRYIEDFKSIENPHSEAVNKYLENIVENESLNNPDIFFNNLLEQTKSLDTSGTLAEALENEINKKDYKKDNLNGFKSFTVFYFISENTSKKLLKNFTHDMKKLQELDPTIDFLVLTRGLIGGTFDTMADYVKSLKDEGIEKIELGFNPWAFEHFDLKQVPAYALSYCEKEYKFKTCEHKYLVRGEMSLVTFFEMVSDKEEMYKKHYFKLIEAKGTDESE